MADVARIAPEVRAVRVPAPLRDLPAWCLWRYETYDGDAKPRKVPFYVSGSRRSGKQGSPEDRAKLTTFTAARDAAARKGFDGVGFAMMPEWGITALDFDNCVDADGRIPADIERIVSRTYAEYSPSGKGIRAFVRGSLGNHKSTSSPDGYGVEVFSSTGFVTVTGDMLPGVDLLGLDDTIADVDAHTIALCERRFGSVAHKPDADDFMAGHEPTLGLSEDEMRDALNTLDPDMDRDGWVRVGMALHHESHGSEDGFSLWDEWSSASDKYPGEEGLRQQWDSFERRKGMGRRQVTMASVLAMVRDAAAEEAKRTATVEQAQAHAESPAFKGKFPVITAASMTAQKPLEWLIKGILPAADLGVIFGASGSGKSFVSLDLGACVAMGQPWREHRVKQGGVIIVTAEGGGSYGKRIKAYCQHHGIDPEALPLGIINAAPNILEAEDIGELTASVKSVEGVSLIIIDTLAQVTPGANENTSEDMGRALANAMVLRRATGAMVVLIHHAGKDLSRGARGWSGIKGALDVEIEVSRDEDNGAREIRLSKMKDEEDGLRFGFKLETVVLGMDADGDEYRSCVAVEDEVRPKSVERDSKSKQRTSWQGVILDAIAARQSRESMAESDLISLAMRYAPEADDPVNDTRRQCLTRAVRSLAKERDGPISLEGNRVIFYE